MMRLSIFYTKLLCLLSILIAPISMAQIRGYSLRKDRVEVKSSSHWDAWSFPHDMVEIDSTGAIRSRYLRGSYNALSDAPRFSHSIANNLRDQFDNAFENEGEWRARGGIKLVHSMPNLAPLAIDGDIETAWEPDSNDDLRDWPLEIDLGRLVTASKIVLRFAESADPFLQFRVYTAGGQNPFGTADRSGALDYVLAGGTSKPNKTQRKFEFELAPIGEHSSGWTGRMVQYIRIAVTDSDRNRAEQISEVKYNASDSSDRGTVEYIWNIAGEERLVSEERYAELSEGQQGGIRYYRQERPQLAEVEVYTVGENTSIGLIDRGGSLHDVNPNSSPELAFDGDISSDWSGVVYDITGETVEWGLLNIDLGAHFRVNAVRLVSRLLSGGDRPLYGYLLRGSAGERAPDGSFIWEDLSGENRLLNQNTRLFADYFDSRSLRYLEFRNLDIARRTLAHLGHRVPSVVSEIQVYSEGYLPRLDVTSDLIDLRSAKNLTTIEWDANVPPNTLLELRTRTGDQLREVKRYFKADGTEVANEEVYNKLPSFFKGDIETKVLPGNGWSNWSEAYFTSGAMVVSPSPRRYMMLKATLNSGEANAAVTLRSVNVLFSSPFAQQIEGEIEPKFDVPIGTYNDFDIFLRPSFTSSDPGFDRIRIIAPSGAASVLSSVELGSLSDFLAKNGDFYSGGRMTLTNALGDKISVVGQDSDTLTISLPTFVRSAEKFLRFRIGSTVFQSGSTFAVYVGNSEIQDRWQNVDPGDVVSDVIGAGEGLTVLTPIDDRLIKMGAFTSLFTPNGDGINDEAIFEFSVLKINISGLVTVQLSDLNGLPIRLLSEERVRANGYYEINWDGRDEKGGLVIPGFYIARIGVSGHDQGIVQMVSVSY